MKRATAFLEILLLSALVLATRCANYPDVFVGGNIIFADGDCYARMTRVRLCAQHPGLIIRHHTFENFPDGVTPHTTAPLDYLILGLAFLCNPFASSPTDLAGALISPLLGWLAGIFLWWWSRRMKFRFRWALLILYAISPILVHGTELGRPDHQSLLIVLMGIALCAEWILQAEKSKRWSIVSGFAWAIALWISLYEPLLLFSIVLLIALLRDPPSIAAPYRRIGWICFGGTLLLALTIEQRLPSLPSIHATSAFHNWSRNIGELQKVSLLNPIWFQWIGWLIFALPLFIWLGLRNKTRVPVFISVLLVATFFLTIWQARWGYFFALTVAIALPGFLELMKSKRIVWIVFAISVLPILRAWDEKLWPNESESARRIEQRHEALELRALAVTLIGSEQRAFIAPWWLSPAIAYWSGQAGVAGSSHESLPGIIDTARFFVSQDAATARDLLIKREVGWVFSYDAGRVEENCASLLGQATPDRPLIRLLDQRPAQAPALFMLSAQNGTGKVYQIGNNR
ncbi:MAG: hypothetical protein QOG67_1510 [Verrucomicrobiota bacterium]|jgi:hypothetical protein